MRQFMKAWSVAAAALLAVTGCSEDKSNAVTAPSAATLQPVGTIQGYLRDRVTQEPIVGAVVDIGVGRATTTADGQFVIPNVPATRDALNNTVSGSYLVTIDLQRVSSPVDMNAAATTTRYPKFAYSTASVVFTSLDDTNGTQPGAGSGTNHDTPVTGLVANTALSVGKLAASFTGVVAGCSGQAFYTPVGAGYTVALIAASASNNSSTGAGGHVVQTQTTDATGAFTFTNVESGGAFLVCAKNAAGTVEGCSGNGATLTAPADGQTTVLAIQASTAVHVCPNDVHGPEVVSITPEPGADLAPGAASVVLGFSEPVAQTSLTTTTPGIPGNLYEHIEVNYAGNKAGNVAYTLAWNEAHDTLTVSFTTAPAGLFWVRIRDIGVLEDAAGRAGALGICPDDSTVPGAYGVAANADANDCTVYFSTHGAAVATNPAALVITNLNTVQATGVPVVLDWLPSVGAKSYNVYKTVYQWPVFPVAASGAVAATGVQDSTTYRLGNTRNTSITDDCPFQVAPPAATCGVIEGDAIPIAVQYTVKGVNADGIEATGAGPTANAADKVAPQLSAAPLAAAFSDTNATAVLSFNEDMNEANAETAGNYAITPWGGFAAPAFAVAGSAGQYLSRQITLQFANVEFALTPGANGVCDTQPSAATDDQAGASINLSEATCVRAGADATVNSTAAGDDAACGTAATAGAGFCPGPDGVCNTAAAAGDLQITAASSVPKCVVEGANGLLGTAAAGDDVVTHAIRTITLSSGVTDVAGNAIDARFDSVTKTPNLSSGFSFAP